MVKLFSLLALTNATSQAQEYHRLEIHPFDFQSEDQYLTTYISGIEFNGENLIIQSGSYPEYYTISPSGRFLAKTGTQGGGPGELLGPPWGLGAFGNLVCVVDQNGKSAHIYENGIFQKQFLLDSYLTFPLNSTSNASAFVGNKVIIPCRRSAGALAIAYDVDNPEVTQKVGQPLDFDEKVLREKPYLNDTMWAEAGGQAFATFDYYPLILQFDADLHLTRRYLLDQRHFVEVFDEIVEFQFNGKGANRPNPLIQDFQVTSAFIYLLSRDGVFRIERTTGNLRDVYRFFGKGDAFTNLAGANLFFEYMAVIDDRSLVLGHTANIWGHDLWQVVLP